MLDRPPSTLDGETVDEQLTRIGDVDSEEIDAKVLTCYRLMIMKEEARPCTSDTAEAKVDEFLSYLVRAVAFGQPRYEGCIVACCLRKACFMRLLQVDHIPRSGDQTHYRQAPFAWLWRRHGYTSDGLLLIIEHGDPYFPLQTLLYPDEMCTFYGVDRPSEDDDEGRCGIEQYTPMHGAKHRAKTDKDKGDEGEDHKDTFEAQAFGSQNTSTDAEALLRMLPPRVDEAIEGYHDATDEIGYQQEGLHAERMADECLGGEE